MKTSIQDTPKNVSFELRMMELEKQVAAFLRRDKDACEAELALAERSAI